MTVSPSFQLWVYRDVTHLGMTWVMHGWYSDIYQAKVDLAKIPRVKDYKIVSVDVADPVS